MKKRHGSEGFTLVELFVVLGTLMIVVVIIGFVGFVVVGGVGMGNYWVGEVSALEAVQEKDPSVTELVKLERHIWGYSRAIVQDSEGVQQEFLLDACILQNTTAILANEGGS